MALNVVSSHEFTITDNTFLYSCSSRFAVSLSPQTCNSLRYADNSTVARNIFRYSEMSAMKLQGLNQATLKTSAPTQPLRQLFLDI